MSAEPPLHRPKQVRDHLATEYREKDDKETYDQLTRNLTAKAKRCV